MKLYCLSPLAAGLLSLAAGAAGAAEAPTRLDPVQVTATREPEAIDHVPASISVVGGAELRARGANDLRTALSLVAGVEGTPGGDAGPAGSVPAIWGLREADAFLLVVDDVPWGGAFNPATPSLDLAGVERIEILRGAAPVMYGATSFSGVIHVIHYAAGEAHEAVAVGGGSYGSYGASGSVNLPAIGGYRQSLTADAEKRGYAEDRTGFKRYHALYRGAAAAGSANFHVDGDVSILPQRPGNLLLRDGGTLHSELPIDANYNPEGAKLNQQRYHLAMGLDGKGGFGRWGTTLAVTRTLDTIERGFLRGNTFANPPDDGVGDSLQADGYSQKRRITDLYFDAHVVTDLSKDFNLTYGLDYLHGSGNENAINYGYCTTPAGGDSACTTAGANPHHPDEIVRSDDTRDFAGVYAQADWKLTPSFDLLAGVRLNHTRESAHGQAIKNDANQFAVQPEGGESLSKTRLSGTIGGSWKAWAAGGDALTFYADYRNSFKPLSIDFGPEAEVQVLKPETASSYEAGMKMQLLDGKLDIDTSVFRMDFNNGLTFAADGTGTGKFVRTNGGKTRFQGLEIESRYELVDNLQLAAHYANHDARFVSFVKDDGADVSGNRFEMSPYQQGGVGLLYAAPRGGLDASLIADYTGGRKLNKSNSREAGGYTTFDAALGYNFQKFGVHLFGYNLTDRRVPVAESEQQEALTQTHTAGYYRLPARSVMANFSLDL